MVKNEDIVIRTAKSKDAFETLHIQKEVVSEADFLTTVTEEFFLRQWNRKKIG